MPKPQGKKHIQLLVVLEINCQKAQSDESYYTDWVMVEIPEEDAKSLLNNNEVHNFIHPKPENEGKPVLRGMWRVIMREMVLITTFSEIIITNLYWVSFT